MSKNYHDIYIMDYVFPSNGFIQISKAESREKNWYINMDRRLHPGSKINMQNFNSIAPPDWKYKLKLWLAMPRQTLGLISPSKYFSTQQISINQMEDALRAFYEATLYNTDIVEKIGFDNLLKAIKQGGYTVTSTGSSKEVTYNRMLNGIKTEFVQAMERLDWAEKKGLMVDYTLHSTMDPNIPTIGTFDISFMPKVSKSIDGIPKRSLTTFDFEEKTNLKRFHMGSATDVNRRNDGSPLTWNKGQLVTDVSDIIEQLKITHKKYRRLVANLLIFLLINYL